MINRNLTYCFDCKLFVEQDNKNHYLHKTVTYDGIEEDKYQLWIKHTIEEYYRQSFNFIEGKCTLCYYKGKIIRMPKPGYRSIGLCSNCLKALSVIVKEQEDGNH